MVVLIDVFFAEQPQDTPRSVFCLASTYCLVRAYNTPNKRNTYSYPTYDFTLQ